MLTNFFGWLAFFSFIALLCTHPIRNKPVGPRLIAFSAFSIAASIGLFVLFHTYDLYSVGQAPSLSRRGGEVFISARRTYAFFSISACILFSAASFWCGLYMLKIALSKKHGAITRRSK